MRNERGEMRVFRGGDSAKDQSYVVHMLEGRELERTLFPVGHMTKAEVRRIAAELGLRTASKPDSQDVCFISTTGGRETFLGHRIPFHRASVVDTSGEQVGEVDAVELVTIGQRRGIGLYRTEAKRFVVDVDTNHPLAGATLTFDIEVMRKVAAVIREARADIVLTHALSDYMEDHMACARLAVSAAFTHGMPNFETTPPTATGPSPGSRVSRRSRSRPLPIEAAVG